MAMVEGTTTASFARKVPMTRVLCDDRRRHGERENEPGLEDLLVNGAFLFAASVALELIFGQLVRPHHLAT